LVDALFGPRELLQLPDPGRSIVRWSDLGPAAVLDARHSNTRMALICGQVTRGNGVLLKSKSSILRDYT